MDIEQSKGSKQIHIIMQGHEYTYELGDILGLYFPREQLKLEKEPLLSEEEFSLLSKLNGAGDLSKFNGICVLTKLHGIGEDLTGEAAVIEKGNVITGFCISRKEKNLPAEWNEKKAGKHLVKYSVFEALQKYTGKRQPWGILTGIRPAKIAYEMLDEGLDENNIVEKIKKLYSVKEDKARLICRVSKVEKEILAKTEPDSISIYIGIPFCPTRCLYCSFTSNPLNKGCTQVEPYLEALFREIEAVGKMVGEKGWSIQSVYIGGGTPTSINEQQLERLLKKVNEYFIPIAEFTLEAGRPDTITEEKLLIAKNYGVDRISINPQTMNEDILKNIGRAHTAQQTVEAFELARKCGFYNINMDIIAGLPGESQEQFINTLEKIRELGPDSLTVHTLAIKRASMLKDHLQEFNLSHPERVIDMLDSAAHYAGLMEMHPYYLYRQKNMLENLENIGYSKPGCESVYNIQIMEEKQTILAIGADGVTKLVYPKENRIERIFNVKNVEEYIKRTDEMIERKRAELEKM